MSSADPKGLAMHDVQQEQALEWIAELLDGTISAENEALLSEALAADEALLAVFEAMSAPGPLADDAALLSPLERRSMSAEVMHVVSPLGPDDVFLAMDEELGLMASRAIDGEADPDGMAALLESEPMLAERAEGLWATQEAVQATLRAPMAWPDGAAAGAAALAEIDAAEARASAAEKRVEDTRARGEAAEKRGGRGWLWWAAPLLAGAGAVALVALQPPEPTGPDAAGAGTGTVIAAGEVDAGSNWQKDMVAAWNQELDAPVETLPLLADNSETVVEELESEADSTVVYETPESHITVIWVAEAPEAGAPEEKGT